MRALHGWTLTAAAGLLLAAGCAPDAWRAEPAFDAFLGHVAKACRGQRIGPAPVDQLIASAGSREGGYFVNQTSRLYAGTITREAWTGGVTAFLSGRSTDAGVRCVLDQLDRR